MSVSAGLRRRPPLVRIGFRALAMGFLLTLAVAGPTLGHADLASSTPVDGAVLATPPTTIALVFTEALDPAKSSFKLNGAGGTIGTGRVSGPDTTMTLDGLALAPGTYEIQWTSAATDGHIERGALTFTVAQSTPAPSAATASASSSPASPSSAPASAPSAPASASSSSAPASASVTQDPAGGVGPASPAAPGDVLLPIVVALAAVAGVGAYLLRRSRRA